MRLHLEDGSDLCEVDILPVSQGYDLVECTEKLKAVSKDGCFVKGSADVGSDAGEEMKGVDVLENVRVLVGDEDHIEVLKRLIDEANGVCLDGGML